MSALSTHALYLDLYTSSMPSDFPSILNSYVPDYLRASLQVLIRTLVDSDSSHCFVSKRFCENNNLAVVTIYPVKLRYLDGSSSIISEIIRLPILFPSGNVHLQDFYVTHLDPPSDLVLGYNWLHRFNPLIDWSAGNISFQTSVTTDRHLQNPGASMPNQVSDLSSDLRASSLDSPGPSMDTSGPSMDANPAPSMETSDAPPSISLISAAAYLRAVRQEGSVQYTLCAVLPEASANATNLEGASDTAGLPPEYHDFANVFSEAEAYNLPPHCEFDLRIETEGQELPKHGHIYSLSQTELDTLREFIDQNLKAGFIYPSKSLFGAPVLFTKKKDGGLRLCVDYRGLNRITKKDCYPLPLIADLLDAPGKARIYTKLDLRHAYHLLRIAEGDEPKTAFRT